MPRREISASNLHSTSPGGVKPGANSMPVHTECESESNISNMGHRMSRGERSRTGSDSAHRPRLEHEVGRSFFAFIDGWFIERHISKPDPR